MIKTASKLAEFLINSRSDHLIATNHCIRYLHVTRHLVIKYVVSRDEELNVAINDEKQMFETTVDVSFVNEEERRSAKEYTFKLFNELID